MLSVAVKANVLLAMSMPMDDDSQSDLADVLASAGAAFTKHWDAAGLPPVPKQDPQLRALTEVRGARADIVVISPARFGTERALVYRQGDGTIVPRNMEWAALLGQAVGGLFAQAASPPWPHHLTAHLPHLLALAGGHRASAARPA